MILQEGHAFREFRIIEKFRLWIRIQEGKLYPMDITD